MSLTRVGPRFLVATIAASVVVLALSGCSGSDGGGGEVVIDAPDAIAAMLNDGAGDDFTYYALKSSPPVDWTAASEATLWICSEDQRPPIIPETIANLIDGGGFPAGTLLDLSWEAQEGMAASSELGFSAMKATIGISYAGCTSSAVEAAGEGAGALLLTDTGGEFEGKDQLTTVVFQ